MSTVSGSMNAENEVNRQSTLGPLWWLTLIFLLLVFTAHFFLLEVYNMPLSPLKLTLNTPVYYWVSPYFTQQWSFFAPTPPSSNTYLVARGQYTESSSDSVCSKWINVSTPLYHVIARNRVTPLFLVELGMSNAISSYENFLSTNPDDIFGKNKSQPVTKPLSPTLYPFVTGYLTRQAIATLEVMYPHRRWEKIQIGLLTVHYPRYSERNDKHWTDPAPSLIRFQWQQYSYVTPFGGSIK